MKSQTLLCLTTIVLLSACKVTNNLGPRIDNEEGKIYFKATGYGRLQNALSPDGKSSPRSFRSDEPGRFKDGAKEDYNTMVQFIKNAQVCPGIFSVTPVDSYMAAEIILPVPFPFEGWVGKWEITCQE